MTTTRGDYTITPVRLRNPRDRRRKYDAYQLTDMDGNAYRYQRPHTLTEARDIADRLTRDRRLMGRHSDALGRDDDNLCELINYGHTHGDDVFPGLPRDCAELYRLRHGIDHTPREYARQPTKARHTTTPATTPTPSALF